VRLQKSNVVTVATTSVLLSVVAVAVVLPLTLLLISGNRANSAIFYMTPLSGILGVLFGICGVLSLATCIQVELLKRQAAVRRALPIYGVLVKIQIAAVQLAFAAFGVVLCLGVFPVQATRRYYDDPRAALDPDDILVRCARMFLIYGAAICLWFVQGPVMRLAMKRQQVCMPLTCQTPRRWRVCWTGALRTSWAIRGFTSAPSIKRS
jgi:hypothetical protein